MKYFLLSLLGFSVCSYAHQKLPNIVILYGDDLGYGDLTSYNQKSKIPTINIDKLANEGMRFTDGHSSSGICTPSRYALLTGRYHWRDFHGIVTSFGKSVFKPGQLNLAKMLKKKGYSTAVIGKWHLGWNWDSIRLRKGNSFASFDWSKPIKNGPLEHGFDYYFGDSVINFPPYTWIENDRVLIPPSEQMDTKKFKKIKEGRWEFRSGPMAKNWNPYDNIPATTAKAVEFIRHSSKVNTPYFLYFAYPSPHAPIIPNDQFDGSSSAGPYGDLLVETDHSIGQLMNAIEDSGEKENTLIIFSADNGPENYAFAREKTYGHWSSYPLRGLKRDVYEGGHRVPLIISYPGVTKPGSVSHALVSQIDIMATIADVIGFDLSRENAAVDSCSMLAHLKDPSINVRSSLVLNTFAHTYGIRKREWVLITGRSGHHNKVPDSWFEMREIPEHNRAQQGTFLYNLDEDIGQVKDLAKEKPNKVKELLALLKSIQDEHGKAGDGPRRKD